MKRRARWTAWLAALVLVAAPVQAGFGGLFKTRVTLPRVRPPAIPLIAERVALEVTADDRDVDGFSVDQVKDRLERALTAGELYRLAERARDADAVVRVNLSRLRTDVREDTRYESRRVKVGERREWNDKKKKYETKDVYADREVPVSWRIASGSLTGDLEVESDGPARHQDLSQRYEREFKRDGGVPREASSDPDLRDFLVAGLAEAAVAAVAFGPDPVEAMLATNGPLKPGNKSADAGRFEAALEQWGGLRLKGDNEAARLHNVGVGHEALAYGLAPFSPEHRQHLEKAQENYRQARALDADEKYFNPPIERIQVSLGYAEEAQRLVEALARFKEERATRRARRGPAPRATPSARGTPPRRPSDEADEPQRDTIEGGSAPSPLRNGDFESALPPWTVSGKAAIVSDPDHGRALELVKGATRAAAVSQPVAADLASAENVWLHLAYRVVAGDGVLRVRALYVDTQQRDRTATLEVSAGEPPGGWSDWSHDLRALRPAPARLKSLEIVVDGGTVRVDDLSLDLR